MEKKENIQNMADEFYDYWLLTHGFLKERTEPEIADWALNINFTDINRESGRFDNQDTNILFHGTISEIKDSVESGGLRATEGAACFTRKISHALNGFAVMGGYTMISNRTIDKFIQDAAEKGVVTGKDLKEQAKHAFEYWCQDKKRESLGLITIWNPPEELIALDSKEKKIHKRHFALYHPADGQSAVGRRRELLNKKGVKTYLSPKYLRFIALPKKALRDKVDELVSAFAH